MSVSPRPGGRLRGGYLLGGWLLVGCLLVSLAACGSTPNRGRPESAPRSWDPAGATPSPVVDPPPQLGEDAPADGAAADAAATPDPRRTSHPPGGPAVARIAGQDVPVGELLLRWMHRESPVVRRYLDELVLERLVVAEASRFGMVLDEARVEQAIARARQAVSDEVRRVNPELSLASFVETRLGLDAGRYLAAIDEQATTELLAERCVRAWTLTSERRDVRVLLCDDRQTVDLVEAGLAQGKDFVDLVRLHSSDPTAEEGGRMPPVVRSQSALSRLAFHSVVGEVAGPIEQNGRYLFLQVEGRHEAREPGWAVLGPEVESSLADLPIADPEYWQWKQAMLERYEVDTEPLLGLVGEPLEVPGR